MHIITQYPHRILPSLGSFKTDQGIIENETHTSGQIRIFHQPIDFPEIRGPISLTKPPFGGNRSCEVAIIWPDTSYTPKNSQDEQESFQTFTDRRCLVSISLKFASNPLRQSCHCTERRSHIFLS